MPVILVLEDDTATRDALAETLRRLFLEARVVATRTDAEPGVVEREGASVVLAGLSTAERLCRQGSSPGVRVVALTREMGPDTLLRAESLGVVASLRAPPSAVQLEAVLGPMLRAAAEVSSSMYGGSASRSGAAAEVSSSMYGGSSGSMDA